MARPPRVELAGGIHHVTARAPSRRELFADAADCDTYLALLAGQVERREWQVFHFCLMGNHLHVLLRTPEPDLGAGIKVAHERFARHVNRRREEHGHVFGSRFYSAIVVRQRHFEACMRYIARNPIEAGLSRRAEGWRWSAHNALLGSEPAPAFLDVDGAFGLIHDTPEAGRVSYQGWVAQPDVAVLATLQAGSRGDDWLVSAVDGHRIEIPAIAEFTGWSVRTVRRRLRDVRGREGTGPGRPWQTRAP